VTFATGAPVMEVPPGEPGLGMIDTVENEFIVRRRHTVERPPIEPERIFVDANGGLPALRAAFRL